MSKPKVQILFTKNIRGDSMLQLKDGRIIFYYFRNGYRFSIYDDKTFRKLYEIDLDKMINKLEKEGKDKIDEEKEEEDEQSFFLHRTFYSTSQIIIKELYDGLILIGYNRYLIELNHLDKTYETKVVKKLNDNILDINELSDKRIIVITKKQIKEIIKESGGYIIKKITLLKENWKLREHPSTIYLDYDDFNQYFSSYVLPNDRLLLNSFSTEYYSYTECANHPSHEFSNSKIIFIDLKNFEEIISTETFETDVKYMIIGNIIVIQAYRTLIIYDINSLNILKNITLDKYFGYMYNYDEQYLIAISEKGKRNELTVYKIENNELIQHYIIRTNIFFN